MSVDLSSIELMQPTLVPAFSREGWVFEFKYDGYRILAGRDDRGVQLLTRNKKDITTRFAAIVRALEQLPGSFAIDGEICWVDERGVPDFEALQARRAGTVNLYAFDLLLLNGRDLRDLPLLERKKHLRQLVPKDHPRVGFVDYVAGAGEALYAHAVGIGLEGVVGKQAESAYRGGRTRLWLKSKPAGLHDGWKRRRR